MSQLSSSIWGMFWHRPSEYLKMLQKTDSIETVSWVLRSACYTRASPPPSPPPPEPPITLCGEDGRSVWCVCVSECLWSLVCNSRGSPYLLLFLSLRRAFSFIYFFSNRWILDQVCFHIENHSIPQTWWNLCLIALKGYFFLFLTQYLLFLHVSGISLVWQF